MSWQRSRDIRAAQVAKQMRMHGSGTVFDEEDDGDDDGLLARTYDSSSNKFININI